MAAKRHAASVRVPKVPKPRTVKAHTAAAVAKVHKASHGHHAGLKAPSRTVRAATPKTTSAKKTKII